MGETNPVFLLIGFVGAILLAVGAVVFIVTSLGGGKTKKSKPILGKTATHSEARPSPSAAGQPLAPDMPAHPGEVMRVIRDRQTGRVLIQVDGQLYANIREIKDAQTGRRVLWAIADLLRFTGGMAANPQALQHIQKPQPAPVEPPPQRPAGETRPARPATKFTPPPAAKRASPEPAGPKGGVGETITGFFQRGLGVKPTASAAPSFIDQIEAILQERIQNLDAPLGCEVHVQAGEEGVLEIQVGDDLYDSPPQVPDPEIRALIQAAVAEWENS